MTLRLAIVGVGDVAQRDYLPELGRLADRVELAVACSRGEERAREVAERFRIPRWTTSYQEVVSADDVDAVLNLTPFSLHVDVTLAALAAGKHVYSEKPLALTSAEARVIGEQAERSGCVARALYGNAGSHWTAWYHSGGPGPLAEAGIYNVKSLTALLGPVVEVYAAETLAVATRLAGGTEITSPDPDVSHVVLRHAEGALSCIVSSQAIQRYRRPAIELYGTDGTANLLGDDWDPRGFEVWRNESGYWEQHDAVEPTWLWADGLREAVACVRADRPPLASLEQDLHLLDVIAAARVSAAERVTVRVDSTFPALELRLEPPSRVEHLHDHTRPSDEQ